LKIASSAPSAARYVDLIRAEYRESPGLRLTKGEIERLWQLDSTTSEAVLATLIDSGVLRRTHSGAYVRADAGDEVPLRPVSNRRPRRQSKTE